MPSSPPKAAITDLASHFESLPDPRVVGRTAYPLLTIVVMAVVALLGGVNGWDAMADFAADHRECFAKFLPLPGGTPSAGSFRRVLSALRPEPFARCVEAWVSEVVGALAGEAIAVDGERPRRAGKRAPVWMPAALHRVHVWATGQRLLLAQTAVEGTPQEPAALLKLLGLLDARDAVVTGDANFCTRAVAEAIVEAGAGYVLRLKRNREAMFDAAEAAFQRLTVEEGAWVEVRHHRETSAGHGRTEAREGWSIAASAVPGLSDLLPGVRSVTRIVRTRVTGRGEVSRDDGFYVSCLRPRVRRIMRAATPCVTLPSSSRSSRWRPVAGGRGDHPGGLAAPRHRPAGRRSAVHRDGRKGRASVEVNGEGLLQYTFRDVRGALLQAAPGQAATGVRIDAEAAPAPPPRSPARRGRASSTNSRRGVAKGVSEPFLRGAGVLQSRPTMDAVDHESSPFRAGLLAGRVVLVTGGGTGIGRAIVEEVGLLGGRVALCGRRLEPAVARADDLAEGLRGRGAQQPPGRLQRLPRRGQPRDAPAGTRAGGEHHRQRVPGLSGHGPHRRGAGRGSRTSRAPSPSSGHARGSP
jgi:hypothetical protein